MLKIQSQSMDLYELYLLICSLNSNDQTVIIVKITSHDNI